MKYRVLLVEDDKALREVTAEGLTKAGYQVSAVAHGQAAMQVLAQEDFDVMVLDWMMPKLNGLEVLKLIEQRGYQIAVLMLTAKSELDHKLQGFEAGADDYLVKPFSFLELLARVQALCKRGKEKVKKLIILEDLRIDLQARQVHLNDCRVELTEREFAILEILAIHQGDNVSYDRIWAHVYGDQTEQSNNMISVYIGHIRRKFSAESSTSYIHAKHGYGYRLALEQA